MHNSTNQQELATKVVLRLRKEGFQALWAGGCVRDRLLGREPKDYDVATSARPEEVQQIFGPRKTLAIGKSFGVITVLGPRSAGQIEVATFRTDSIYSDGRHPDAVEFSTAEEDAQRRDFTINGLFFDPVESEVIDYVSGEADLAAQLIRAIGDPTLRIAEDKLRMLRAIRFATTLDFEIEAATFAAIRDSASEISCVSAERIGMEVRRMLVDDQRARAVGLMKEADLLPHVFPEVAGLESEEWKETLRVLAELPASELPVAMAALLHQTQANRIASKVGRRLRLTNKEIERIGWLLEKLPVVQRATEVSWPELQRVLVYDGAAELIDLLRAIEGGDSSALKHCVQQLALPAEQLNPEPLVDGADLIAHGLVPGPSFSAALEAIRDAQLLGSISSREEALLLAEGMIHRNE